jgi:TonB-dependent SusC/RagA subfamily outer membrane receptor
MAASSSCVARLNDAFGVRLLSHRSVALSAGVFLFALSRAALGQRPDTVAADHWVLLPRATADTSDRLFGNHQLPRSLGASVGVIDSAMIASSFARTLSELLAARVPGVSVMRSSGIVGGGSRVRLRGATGIYATREPIVVVDGVRVDAMQNAPGLSIGGQQPSRLDDIDIDQIARIEVLRGPAASALYGTNGAGGVIRITTRAASRAKTSWSTYGEGGISTDITGYPANYSTGSGITGEPTCTRAGASIDACSPGPLRSWNPLENASPFRTAARVKAGASLSGGWRSLGYLVSGTAEHAQGVLEPNDATRYAFRVNADARPVQSLDLALRTSYTHALTTLPIGDLAGGTPFNGLAGNAIDDPVDRGYRTDGIAAFADVPTDQRVGRAAASFAATWRPERWLTARAIAGGEAVRRDDARSLSVTPEPSLPTVTRVEGSTGRDRSVTLGANATASFNLARSLETETTVGIEWLGASRRSADSTIVMTSDGAGARDLLTTHTKPRVTGLIASERLAWHDRRFIGLGVRHDRTTVPEFDATTFAPATFVSADAAWVLGDEPFFPHIEWLSRVRLRGAWGRSADYRSYFSTPNSSFPFAGEVSPERIAEAEVGLDALLLQRVWVDATWYRQSSDDAVTCCLVGTPVPNGAWHTTGLDAALSAEIIKALHVEWSARLTMSFLANRFDGGQGARDQGISPVLLPRVRSRNVAGHPIAGIWGNPTRTHDDNGDGIITPAEVDVLPDSVYLGSSTPTRELGLTSTVAFHRVTVSALLDYRGGFSQLNGTADNRCEFVICGALYDPRADLDEQSRAIAIDRAGAGFVEDASFLRLRELGVSWAIVPGWAYRHGFARLSTTLIARNLLTFTGYSGFDPETNYRGQTGLGTGDLYTLPLPRAIALRFDLVR